MATGDTHAFFWEKGVMLDLGTLAGDSISSATSINDHSQVVGASISETGVRPFLWTEGVMSDSSARSAEPSASPRPSTTAGRWWD